MQYNHTSKNRPDILGGIETMLFSRSSHMVSVSKNRPDILGGIETLPLTQYGRSWYRRNRPDLLGGIET